MEYGTTLLQGIWLLSTAARLQGHSLLQGPLLLFLQWMGQSMSAHAHTCVCPSCQIVVPRYILGHSQTTMSASAPLRRIQRDWGARCCVSRTRHMQLLSRDSQWPLQQLLKMVRIYFIGEFSPFGKVALYLLSEQRPPSAALLSVMSEQRPPSAALLSVRADLVSSTDSHFLKLLYFCRFFTTHCV